MALSNSIIILAFVVFALLYALETGTWNWFTISVLVVLAVLSIPSFIVFWAIMKDAFTRKRDKES